MSELQVGDVNVPIRLTVVDSAGTAVDLSGYSTLEILLDDPDGNTSTLTASFTTDGTDGKIEAATTSGLIDEAGTWFVQAKVSDGTTTIRSRVAQIQVYDNLD